MFKTFILVCLLLLQACGSGGTPSTLGQITFTEGGAYIAPGVVNSDPNTVVTEGGITYDLRRSTTPDEMGNTYSSDYSSGSWKPASTLYFWGKALTNNFSCLGPCTGPELSAPPQEVIDAWNQGWTGKGINVLIEDSLTLQHGVITGLLAYRYAPGANFYGLDIVGNSSTTNVFFNQTNSASSVTYGNYIKLGVVNQSYTADLPNLIKDLRADKSSTTPWTVTELENVRRAYEASSASTINRMKDIGLNGQLANFYFSDAVITKAAGNDSIRSEYEPLNWYLAKDDAIRSRLLIVGALNQEGSINSPATIADYSNTAGTDDKVSSRFLLANGTTPSNDRWAIDSVTVSQGRGTSYAAPRIAGYVAIVRSKFPNLNANNTASILLKTARYDTLACSKNGGTCDPTIYGKGEASLSRALAPVGKLR